MKETSKNWGNFPTITPEEILCEDNLEGDGFLAGVQIAETGEDIGKELDSLQDELKDQEKKSHAEAKTYGLLARLIHPTGRGRNPGILGALEQSRIFKVLRPEISFVLAIKAVRANDKKYFETIVGNTKKEHPTHPELGRYRCANGETLGHLAAKCDQPNIIKALLKIDPDCLEIENYQKENIAHTASRYCSWKALDFIADTRPDIFAKKNAAGETPLDLEGGKLIQTKLDINEAKNAESDAAKKKDAARTLLQEAITKPLGKPLVEVEAGKLKSRREEEFPTIGT